MPGHQYDYGEAKKTPGDFVMPLGKFKGEKLRDIQDLTYLDWIIGQGWLNEATHSKIKAFLQQPATRRDLEQQLERKSTSR